MSRRVGHIELESGRRRSAARTAPKNGGTKVQYQKMWLPIATAYSTPLQKLLLAMERRLHIGREVVAAEEADAEEVEAAVAGFEQLPTAVQKMWVMSHDDDKFREHARAVVQAYNKSLEAGATESTAERAAAAAAYAIHDSGYREYIEHEKKWQLARCAAAAKLEELAMKARRLLKKARKLVAAGTLPKRLQIPEDAFPPRQAMNIARAIRDEVRCMREMIVQLDVQARAIPCQLDLPFSQEEVYSCMCSVDRMEFQADLAYKRARLA